ncbi:DUF1214 domain-containing protein [Moritella sp. 28]|uniref:DUF1214 domain-containing protein n=1 Tax=Moritella sp. 28 TaxID=2746232 RepID=UPI001BA993A5|nr:DUF1214 domain-containing protein [Moritella sp. 28]QUM85417.1 DUF1214 domain-containing protein [Moritella sp. 28]
MKNFEGSGKNRQLFLFAAFLLASVTATANNKPSVLIATNIEQFFSPKGLIVTKEYYPVAESARQMLETQKKAGGVNRFEHLSQLTRTSMQPVVRMNRDAYYSKAVIDVSAGASITLPEVPKGRYFSMQPVTLDHRPQAMSYGAGTYELATHRGEHMIVIIRLDSNFSPKEVKRLQQKIIINANSNKKFSSSAVQKESFYQVENQLKANILKLMKQEGPVQLSTTLFSSPTDETRSYYQPDKNQTAAAIGWGGALAKDNIYETSPNYPANGCYQMTFEDPKNRDFWSITVYNKQGFMFDDKASTNSYKAKPNTNGTYTISLGCSKDSPNRIPIVNESGIFSITVRHYGPSERVIKKGYRLVPLLKSMK